MPQIRKDVFLRNQRYLRENIYHLKYLLKNSILL